MEMIPHGARRIAPAVSFIGMMMMLAHIGHFPSLFEKAF
jgi:hypothetical protein